MSAQAYVSAGRTETGKVRRLNEDALLVREDAGLWVVADGLGGHSAGDHASGLIVQRLAALQRPDDVCDFIDAIDDALEQVNAELLRFAAEREVDLIGSTVVVLVHDPAFMACAWVGDSRVYRWGDGGLRQITADHVHGQKDDETRFNTGPPGGQNAPAPGALTKAVGAQEPLFVDWVVAESVPGTRFVLCSDGINKEIDDGELGAECERGRDPQSLVARLFELALGRAGRDNVTAVVVDLKE